MVTSAQKQSGENKITAMADSFSGSVKEKCAPGSVAKGELDIWSALDAVMK